MALRLSGQLLLGVVRVYKEQVGYRDFPTCELGLCQPCQAQMEACDM